MSRRLMTSPLHGIGQQLGAGRQSSSCAQLRSGCHAAGASLSSGASFAVVGGVGGDSALGDDLSPHPAAAISAAAAHDRARRASDIVRAYQLPRGGARNRRAGRVSCDP